MPNPPCAIQILKVVTQGIHANTITLAFSSKKNFAEAPPNPCPIPCFLNPMLVDSADGVNEADEGIEGGGRAKKEPER